jgi:uncharacterized membrane protein YhaH (DUF805 family)
MSTESTTITASPFQLKLKNLCIGIEKQFDKHINRQSFALRMVIAAVIFGGNHFLTKSQPDLSGGLTVAINLILAVAFVWTGLQIVRRFHDMERTGGLIWAIVIPVWAIVKVTEQFPDQWIIWLVLFGAVPLKLFLELLLKKGIQEAAEPEAML